MQMLRFTTDESEFRECDCTALYAQRNGVYILYGYLNPESEYHDSDDSEAVKAYELFGEIYADEFAAETELNSAFLEYCREFGVTFHNDIPALRECFNNWADSLNRDGVICDDSASDLNLSDELENKLT